MFKKIILFGLMALGLVNAVEAQFTPQNPNASQSTVTATGTAAARTLAARASDVANVLDYGAYGDAIRTQTSVTTTSGSPTATISGISSSYVGTNIVIGGAGASGAPLATTISAVSGSTVTLGSNAGTTLSAVNEYVSYGHDDTVAIQAAMNSGSTEVIFPANKAYGHYSQITLPNSHRTRIDCQGSTLVALASMTNQFYQTSNSNFYASQGSNVQNCMFEGMGVVTHNLNHGSYAWSYNKNVYLDALTSNILCNGQCENTYFSESQITNYSSLTPTYPSYLIDNEYTDNHYTDIIGSGGQIGIYDNSSGTYWTNIHVYYITGTNFYLNGSGAHTVGLYADTVAASQTGIILAGNQISLLNWYVSGPSTVTGVSLPSGASYDTVIGGVVTGGITSANAVVQYNASNGTVANNTVVGNVGSNYSSLGNGGTCLGYSVSCGSNTSVAIGPYTTSYYGDFAIGHGANSTGSNSYAFGYGAYATGTASYSIGNGITVAGTNEMSLDNIWIGYTTAPTVTSGLGTSPTVTAKGTHVFKVTVGATGTPSTTAVIGMPTAPTDWVCPYVVDRTTPSVTGNQTGSASTTSFTVTFNTAPSNSDVLEFMCDAI